MFSLISLYFAYRRDVVLAERYMAGLDQRPANAPAPVAAAQQPVVEDLKLAA